MSGGEMPKYAKISIKATNIKLHLMQIKAPHALYQHNAHIFQNSQPTEALTTILAPGFVYLVVFFFACNWFPQLASLRHENKPKSRGGCPCPVPLKCLISFG